MTPLFILFDALYYIKLLPLWGLQHPFNPFKNILPAGHKNILGTIHSLILKQLSVI